MLFKLRVSFIELLIELLIVLLIELLEVLLKELLKELLLDFLNRIRHKTAIKIDEIGIEKKNDF